MNRRRLWMTLIKPGTGNSCSKTLDAYYRKVLDEMGKRGKKAKRTMIHSIWAKSFEQQQPLAVASESLWYTLL